MKIFTFQGGLGNQMFQYTYYRYLKSKYPKEKFYGFYPEVGLKAHNGLEINKWFDAELPQSCWFSNLIGRFLYKINLFLFYRGKKMIFTDYDWQRNEGALFIQGFWQDKQYVEAVGAPSIKENLVIDEENKRLIEILSQKNSVAIHVRRGDYTDPEVQHIYGGICTPEYYNKAIELIKEKVDSPRFFFFSDEPEYVKQNFHVDNMEIVSHNVGDKSFYDLLLMSNASNMVLANSTFSCWGAYLNKKVDVVISPSKIRNDKKSPDILRESWLKI